MSKKSIAGRLWHSLQLAVGITIALAVQRGCQTDAPVGEPWSVVDSKGRVRLRTEEVGEGFRLLFQDAKGRPRLALTVDATGAPSVQALDEGGQRRAVMGQDKSGAWAVGVQRPGGLDALLVEGAGGGALTGLVLRKEGGDPLAAITSNAKSDETKVFVCSPSGAGRNGAQLWSRGDREHGFAVFKEPHNLVAGTISNDDNFVTWMGSGFAAGRNGHGVMLGYDPKLGAQLLLHHPEGKGLLLRESPSGGAGIKAGLSGDSAQLGVGANGPSVRVKSGDGRAGELRPK